ncbi:MAG: hypothetical protein DMF77_24085 [Acidobacteria bacterium]|nr:MAG: hypothetical protein DMF77_24085 [Acidobacteriota bacterium]
MQSLLARVGLHRPELLFGALAGRLGVKRTLFIPVAVYVVVAVLGYRMKTAADFFVLGGGLLAFVNVDEGRRHARAAEAALGAAR